jgi:molecular chaperone DnaJ
MVAETDFYDLLEVDPSADERALKSAYRKMAMKFHPDRNPGDAEAEARFKAVGAAYECLKDPQKRAAYDRYGKAAFEEGGFGGGGGRGGPEGFSDIGDIFDTIFGGGFGGRGGGRRGPARGADLRYDLEISLEDAFHGKSTEIHVEVAAQCGTCDGSGAEPGTSSRSCNLCSGTGKMRAQQGFFVVERTCPNCHGRGDVIEKPCGDCRGEGRIDEAQTLKVDIPAGVDNGTRIRLSGKGEAGPRGASPGDMYIFIHVTKHKIFEREGSTLFTQVPISFIKAALGCEIAIPGMDGKETKVSIPAGIQSGKQLSQRGAGMPVLQGRGRGDLVVQIDVETPTKLSAKQKDILREFQETETGDECPNSRGFFDKLRDFIG